MSEIIYDWNTIHNEGKIFKHPVELCDETLRDGIQSPSVRDPDLNTKLRMVELMAELGITIANIGLPGAGPRTVNHVTELARHVRDQKLNIKVNCAARTHQADIAPIATIQHEIGIPITAYCFLGTSPIRQYVEDWDFDRLLKVTDEAVTFALKQNLEVAFVTEDTTRSNPETLEKLFKHVIELGSRRLVLCDTVGHATPEGVKNLVEWTKKLIAKSGEEVAIDWHGHNDRGLAVVNALFAAEYGCHRIHGTCLGIGERVGNAAIDQLIVNLKLLDAYPHDVSKLAEYAALTGEACQVGVPYNYPMCGRDAFRTATGVHAAAVIKAAKKQQGHTIDTIYSGVPAHWFGREQEIEIGPMSGLSNVRYWLEKRGLKVSESTMQAILAHAKKGEFVLLEEEILALLIVPL